MAQKGYRMLKPLKVKDVAELFDMRPEWVYANAEKLGGAKIGGTWFFHEHGIVNAIFKQGEEDRKQSRPQETKTLWQRIRGL